MADEGEYIEVTWGPEVYTPVAYHALTIGPYRMRAQVREGETAGVAFARAWNALDKAAQWALEKQKDAYLDRVGSLASEAKARAKAARG